MEQKKEEVAFSFGIILIIIICICVGIFTDSKLSVNEDIEEEIILSFSPSLSPTPKYTDESCKKAQEVDYPDLMKEYKNTDKISYSLSCYSTNRYSSYLSDDLCVCQVCEKTITKPAKQNSLSFEKESFKSECVNKIEFYLK